MTLNPSNNPSGPTPEIRVAHLVDGRHFGGAEQMVRRLAGASSRAHVKAWVYCLSEGRLAEFLRAEGLNLRVFPSSGRFDFRMIGAMIRAARHEGIQVLQAHTSRTHLIARLMSRRLRIPNITTIHSPIAWDENRGGRRYHSLRAWVERKGRPWTSHIVTVSQEEAQRLVREEGVPPSRIDWIPNGMDPIALADESERRTCLRRYLEEHGLPSAGFIVVMIAQLRPRKGPEILLQAAAKWLKSQPDGMVLIIGDDEFTGRNYLEELKNLARGLGISGRVHFAGFLSAPWELAQGADLFALPSLFGEGLPLVLLEAMNYGLALAVSDTPGNRELVSDKANGWLHRPGDAELLSQQILEACGDREETRRRGAAGRRIFLNQFTLDHVINQYRTLYGNLIN